MNDRTEDADRTSWKEYFGDVQERVDSDYTKRVVVVSIAVTLEKIRYLTGSGLVSELISSLQNEECDANVIRSMISSWDDCRQLTEEVIKESMDRASWSEK